MNSCVMYMNACIDPTCICVHANKHEIIWLYLAYIDMYIGVYTMCAYITEHLYIYICRHVCICE